MTEKEKICKYLEYKEISKNKFYALTGLSNGFLDSGKSLGADKIKIIIEKFPDLNLSWLVLNEGEMLKKEDTAPHGMKPSDNGQGIPLLPISAMAGALSGDIQVLEYDCAVKGSSMYPKYASGDIVACKRIAMDRLFFQWNKVYVIDTDQGALIKRIKPGSDDEHICIVSDNVKYEPFELPISSIYAVALVIGVIRLE